MAAVSRSVGLAQSWPTRSWSGESRPACLGRSFEAQDWKGEAVESSRCGAFRGKQQCGSHAMVGSVASCSAIPRRAWGCNGSFAKDG
jgi:hypothetical protein